MPGCIGYMFYNGGGYRREGSRRRPSDKQKQHSKARRKMARDSRKRNR